MELTCYVHEGWAPRIRPATARRDWMEDTPERFAYRCLPLAIANAHGWELLSPCGFSARWRGGRGTEAVQITVDPGTPAHKAPVSLFGQGTLTFHVEGLIRTSPGWNLWVGGEPNAAKDGIAPLGGVIETDWSPYSFTMNWRFTRRDHWVRFEEDEPFCFFFPVRRGVLEGVEPVVRPLADDPALFAAFRSWSASREAFQAHVRRARPKAPADKWQKLYYRGVNPDGSDGPPDHAAKLRLADFAAPSCPVAGGAPAAGRAAGDDAPPCPAAAAPTADDAALARCASLLAVAARQRALSARASAIDRVTAPSGDEFLDRFYAPGRPVVLTGAMADWPAASGWTVATLRRAIGDAPVEHAPATGGDAVRRLSFDDYADRLAAGDADIGAVTTAGSSANAAALAPLRAAIGPLDAYLAPGDAVIRIAPAGAPAPPQFAAANLLLAQAGGATRLTLWPPGDMVAPMRGPGDGPDAPPGSDVMLAAGELAYVPVGWWYRTQVTMPGVTLAYANFRWPNPSV